MIHGIASNSPIPNVGYVLNASVGGKLALPVEPVNLVYSHFKHVSGTPAPEGIQGVNITKLRILDTMIEQLSRMKSRQMADDSNQSLPIDGNNEKRLDALIEHYQSQIKTAHSAAVYTPAAPAAGALFSIAV